MTDLRLMGGLRVEVDGADVGVTGATSRRLLALLALHRNDAVGSDRIADVLWRDDPPRDPVNAIQAAVSRLRRTLGPAGAELVRTVPNGYRMVIDPTRVDVDRFDEHVTAGRRHLADDAAAAAVHEFDAGLAIWAGEPYPELPDDHRARAEARRVVERRRVAVAERAQARLVTGHHAEVVAELAAEVADAPLDEDLHALVMTALARSGRATEALEVFTSLRARLVDELGVEPGPALQSLQRAVLDQAPDVVAVAPTTRFAAEPGTDDVAPIPGASLPTVRGSFLGREGALGDVAGLVGSHVIVTLVGPGGTGKTRLAVEVARTLGGATDGPEVVAVELAATADPRAVVPAVAAALGVTSGAAASPAGVAPVPLEDRIAGHLAGRDVVVVLDNCEHLLDAAAAAADLLVDAGARVLATSREPLRVDGEYVWVVPPLEVPAPGVTDPGELLAHGAVALLVDRARRRAPGFRLDQSTSVDVARLCRRLDGLPLALELAASRLSSMSVADLAERLDDRFALLTGGARTATSRQRTLEGVLDWSHDLLDEHQRTVLRRLSVFAGGFDLPDAEAVCADDATAAAGVAAALGDLVDKSLVVFDGAPDGRHRLLDTVRVYAGQRLEEAGDGPRTRRRHLARFLEVARGGRVGLRGADQLDWIARLERARDDLGAAGAWALQADPGAALELGAALAWFWWLRDHHDEGVRFLADASGRAPDDVAGDVGDPALRAEAAAWRAFLLVFTPGGLDQVDDALARVQELADAVPETLPSDRIAVTAVLRGFVELVAGRPVDLVLARFDRAQELASDAGDEWTIAATAFCRAQALVAAGRPAEGQDEARRSIEVARAIGDRWAELQSRQWLGMLAAATGDHAGAARQLERAVELAEPLTGPSMRVQLEVQLVLARSLAGDPQQALKDLHRLLDEPHRGRSAVSTAWIERGLGLVHGHLGEHRAAVTRHRAAARRFGTVGEEVGRVEALADLGLAAARDGRLDVARAAVSDAVLELPARAGLTTRALVIEAAAFVAAEGGDGERAAALVGAAEARREAAGLPLVGVDRRDVDAVLTTARTQVGVEAVARARSTGRQAALDDLLVAAGFAVPHAEPGPT